MADEFLEIFTKELFQVGMREWRVGCIIEGSENMAFYWRIIASDPNEALILYFTEAFGYDEEYFNSNYPRSDIQTIESLKNDRYHQYEIPDRWKGVYNNDFTYPQIFRIDPFSGEMELVREYPNGFSWYFWKEQLQMEELLEKETIKSLKNPKK